jgi:lipoate-protein ligase B
MIRPCGITEYGVTSLERLMGQKTPIEEIRGKIAKNFAKVFGIEIKEKNVVKYSLLAENNCNPQVVKIKLVNTKAIQANSILI